MKWCDDGDITREQIIQLITLSVSFPSPVDCRRFYEAIRRVFCCLFTRIENLPSSQPRLLQHLLLYWAITAAIVRSSFASDFFLKIMILSSLETYTLI